MLDPDHAVQAGSGGGSSGPLFNSRFILALSVAASASVTCTNPSGSASIDAEQLISVLEELS